MPIIFTTTLQSDEPNFFTGLTSVVLEALLMYLPFALVVIFMNALTIYWHKKRATNAITYFQH